MRYKKSFGDEEFLHLIKDLNGRDEPQPVQEHINNINDGYIIIGEIKYLLEERKILNNRASIIMPEIFAELPKEIAEVKYQSKNRPEFIYANPEATVNLTFSHKSDEMHNSEAEEVKNGIQEVVMRMNPASQVIESAILQASQLKINIAYFDFVSAAIDTEIYNLMFVFSLGGRIVLGAFNCMRHEMYDWKDIFIQMLGSVNFLH